MVEGRRTDRQNADGNKHSICTWPWTLRTKCSVGGGIFLFLVIIFSVMLGSSIHKIQEGTVGIYFVSGALQEEVTYPGIHYSIPFITDVQRIQVRPRTDTMPPINTITRDGIENIFHDVQVISDVKPASLVSLVKKFGLEFHKTLVFDRIYEELRIFCANHTIDEVYNTMFLNIVGVVTKNVVDTIADLGEGGITIYHLTVPKPQIPQDIAKNYKEVKVQWTEQLVATQQQKTEKIKKETETIKAVADAERQKEVSQIHIEKEILQKEGEKTVSTIQNEIVKDREKSMADVDNYSKKKLAEANEQLYSPEFISLETAKALSQNTKFFFSGDNSPLGAVLAKIMGES